MFAISSSHNRVIACCRVKLCIIGKFLHHGTCLWVIGHVLVLGNKYGHYRGSFSLQVRCRHCKAYLSYSGTRLTFEETLCVMVILDVL